MNDKQIIKDYQNFRKIRFSIHIKSSEWNKMSKKTKKALLEMFEAALRYRDSMQAKKEVKQNE